jgi:hypothetical protein
MTRQLPQQAATHSPSVQAVQFPSSTHTMMPLLFTAAALRDGVMPSPTSANADAARRFLATVRCFFMMILHVLEGVGIVVQEGGQDERNANARRCRAPARVRLSS